MKDRSLDTLIHRPKTRSVPFDALMPHRVRNILLVSSLYDFYTFEEDGRFSELLISDFLELNIPYTPRLERVSTGDEAIERLRVESFDLVVSMIRVGEMNIRDFGQRVHEMDPDLPVILLAYDTRELTLLKAQGELPGIDRVFVWFGDVRLFMAIIKYVEDRKNALHDARVAGVKSIILLEDSARFYSSYLPMLYTEVVEQTQALMADGVNRMQKLIRQRARPKILLGTSYEEGLQLFEQYRDHLLGLIVDASVPRAGKLDTEAGCDFARKVRQESPDTPILIQTGSLNEEFADSIGARFIDKHSPSLLHEVREFMREYLGFGDFVFRMPEGTIVDRAKDLRGLEEALHRIPDDSLLYHALRDDFSMWLMARTEFDLAKALRPRKVGEFKSTNQIRTFLLDALGSQREHSLAGVVAEFSSGSFEASSGFVRIGQGSLGGKGRGLAFINALIETYDLTRHFPDVRIFVPPTAVVATGLFEEFMGESDLTSQALHETSNEEIGRAFLSHDLPEEAVENLREFLNRVRYPLAVRSSSLLEDSFHQPFAGIYSTFMIPNNHEDPKVRLEELCNAIKLVYASTYYADSKAYIQSTPNRLEEEKMAVIIQQMVGKMHEPYLYPNIAGVARSVNFYPTRGMKPEEGVASVALGLGKTVVEGGRCVRFSPASPKMLFQFSTTKDYLENAQGSYLALDMSHAGPRRDTPAEPEFNIASLDLRMAKEHGTLEHVGSVYVADSDRVFDGVNRKGVPLVTMAGVLKRGVVPLPEVLSFLLKVGAAGFSCPVEIEFAVNISDDANIPHEFGFLQIRPIVMGMEAREIHIGKVDPSKAICISHQALGRGVIDGIRDLIYVKPEAFEWGKTRLIALELAKLNEGLRRENRPYIIFGPGRWGSADPWLGIPVKWAQISGARCIVETDQDAAHVDPSQGSHFFQNITSLGIGYLTVVLRGSEDTFDTEWLSGLEPATETRYLKHISFENPLKIILDGRQNFGVVMKPTA